MKLKAPKLPPVWEFAWNSRVTYRRDYGKILPALSKRPKQLKHLSSRED